jgi:hypothetical protein
VITAKPYSESSGAIVASISASEGTSSITIPAPFPNESPLLFSSWKTGVPATAASYTSDAVGAYTCPTAIDSLDF